MKKNPTLIAMIFLFIACNNRPAGQTPSAKTPVDNVKDEVMAGHNKAMAKMSRLHEAQKRVQQMIDSFSRLPADMQKRSTQYKVQLDSTLTHLNFADYAMDKWMNEFNMDSESNDLDKRLKYLESEKIKISKVRDDIISSLQRADSVLNHLK